MIWWYNTVFLNREQPVATTQSKGHEHSKHSEQRTGFIGALITKVQSYQQIRREKITLNESIAALSKLSLHQLEDVGLVPADLIRLKHRKHKVEHITQYIEQNRSCEICYLPNVSMRNLNANDRITPEYSVSKKAA